MDAPREIDVAIVGAGFGGLGCAVALAEAGRRPVLFEALKYPGGCASTFTRDGTAFESGATLFSGLDGTGLFGRWIDRYQLPVQRRMLDPVVTLRLGPESLEVSANRDTFVEQLARRSGPHGPAVARFFQYQRAIADTLWGLFSDPALLPPFDARMLLRHLARTPKYLPLLPLLGRPLGQVLAQRGLEHAEPLRSYLKAICQITVQCSPEVAETPFAMAAIDYPWRGTGHVVGGVGRLATGLTDLVTRLGGEVRFAERIAGIERRGTGFELTSARGSYRARQVVLNLQPDQAGGLLDQRVSPALLAGVASGWGACMLYRVVRAPANASADPIHLELVDDVSAPFTEGNHVFVSISGVDEPGKPAGPFRAMTVSTHVALGEGAAQTAAVQERMRETMQRRAPEWCDVESELTASPRTFERFIRRTGGAVGGVPRRAGLRNYRTLGPTLLGREVWLVGDSVFLGQSILASALGGVRTAAAMRVR